MNRTEQIKIGIDAASLIAEESEYIERDYPIFLAEKVMNAARNVLSPPPEWADRLHSRTLMYEVVSRAFEEVGIPGQHEIFYDEIKTDLEEILDEYGQQFIREEKITIAANFCEKIEERHMSGRRARCYLLWEEGYIDPAPDLKREFEEVDSFNGYVRGKAMSMLWFDSCWVGRGRSFHSRLRDHGILEVGDLTELTRSELLDISGIGEKTARRICDGLYRLDLELQDEQSSSQQPA